MKIAHYKCSLNDAEVCGVKIADIKHVETKTTYDCDILVWNNKEVFYEDFLSRFPRLKMFVLWGTDDDLIDESVFVRNSIIVKKNDFYATEALAEYVTSLLFMFERQHMRLIKEKIVGGEIYRAKVGIIGMGKIGARVASVLCHAFHCKVMYYSRTNKHVDWANHVSLEEIFAECDYAIITSKSSDFSIDIKNFHYVNPFLVVVNIARDSVLPFASLLPLLKSEKMRGFVGDIDPPSEMFNSQLPKSRLLLSPHRGYLTHNAIDIKHNTLAFYVAKILHKNWKIYMVRHGETEWNKQGVLQGSKDSPLSEAGRGHAQKVARHLRNSGVRHIYASPLGRAQETAKTIAEQTGAKITVMPEFAEMNFGAFEGKDKRQVEELFADFFEKRKESTSHKLLVSYPSGESYYDVYLRVLQPLLQIMARAESCIIVGHESVNRMLRGIMLEQQLEQMVGSRQKNNEVVEVDVAQSRERVTVV